MYGMVNKAFEGLFRSRYGDEVWHRIREDAGVPDEPFLSMKSYPDAMTYGLVGSAEKILGIPAAELMDAFADQWIEHQAVEGYGELLRSAGDTLPEFLRNLDQLHTRVKLALPALEPPSFRVSDETADGLVLDYFSERPGLAPLVAGLLRALGPRFGLVVTSTHREVEGPPRCVRFDVRWRTAREAD